MARSLRDELLKAGLVTREQASRAERGSRPRPRSRRGKRTASKAVAANGGDVRRVPRVPRPCRRVRSVLERSPSAGSRPVSVRPPDPEEQVRRLNVEIRRILDTEAEKVEGETDTPFHFPRGQRLKRLYVSEDQRRRLTRRRARHRRFPGSSPSRAAPRWRARARAAAGGVRVHRRTATAVRSEVEAGYEGYEVPDELVW